MAVKEIKLWTCPYCGKQYRNKKCDPKAKGAPEYVHCQSGCGNFFEYDNKVVPPHEGERDLRTFKAKKK